MINEPMQNQTVPETLKPLFWSYDFSRLDPVKHKRTIIVQVLNYGNLDQWRWLLGTYGRDALQDAVAGIQTTEFKIDALRLAPLLLGVECKTAS